MDQCGNCCQPVEHGRDFEGGTIIVSCTLVDVVQALTIQIEARRTWTIGCICIDELHLYTPA